MICISVFRCFIFSSNAANDSQLKVVFYQKHFVTKIQFYVF